MILTNPKKIDDRFAMELYKVSTLNEISYFRAMTACAICGYINKRIIVYFIVSIKIYIDMKKRTRRNY